MKTIWYAIRQNLREHDTPSSSQSSNNQLFPAEKMKVRYLEIFFIESTSEFQTSVTFLVVNVNKRCGKSFSLL